MDLFRWFIQLSLSVVVAVMLSSCSAPHQTFEAAAEQSGLEQRYISTSLFSHKVFYNHRPASNEVHVYFAGDGTPWLNGKIPATDPTPRHSIALKLMHKERTAAYLLGRPCYHGLHLLPECSDLLWTSGRYSQAVVESMYWALTDIMENFPATTPIVLIGYSGGATLASLVAHFNQSENRLNIRKIISIAGNQDINAWADYHNVPRLKESLDPMQQPGLPTRVESLFFTGREDRVVLPEHSKAYAQRQLNSRFVVFDDFDHNCCWDTIWLAVLSDAGFYIDKATPATSVE